MVNIYDVFRYNQRIRFVFDMGAVDKTGGTFVVEGDSIDARRECSEDIIVRSDNEMPKAEERKGCSDDQ